MFSFPPRTLAALLLALFCLAIVAIGANWFIQSERNRDLVAWQTRLSIVADGRKAAIEDWVAAQYGVVRQIADNEAVQIYVMGLAGSGAPRRDAPQAEYLRNLLTMIAQTKGFVDRHPVARIPANVRSAANSGLLLFTQKRQLIAASESAPAIDGALADFIAGLPADRPSVHGPYLGEGDAPLLAFAAPIFALHATQGAGEPAGYVVAVKEIADELFPLLVQPGEPARTAEAQLVRRDGDALVYLSPRRDGAKPLTRRLADNTPNLDIAFAAAEPGGFAIKIDYSTDKVLVTGRRLAGVSWILAYKVDYDEAMAVVDFRTKAFAASFALAALLFVAVGAFAWKFGTSRRMERLSELYRATATELAQTRDFLIRLRDEDPSPTFAADAAGKILYANAAFARKSGTDAENLTGKTLAQIAGPHAAANYREAISETLAVKTTLQRLYELHDAGATQYLQAKHMFVPAIAGRDECVLVIEDDVTQSVLIEKTRRENQEKIVAGLVSMIDQLDPNAKRHSVRAASVAVWLAGAIGLDETQTRAVEQAALLANVGKIFVPSETLRHPGVLTETALNEARSALMTPYSLLVDMGFEQATLDMIRLSRCDSTEVRSSDADDAVKTGSQIVAVANAFVALVSDRPYRPSYSVDQALEILLTESAKRYERRIVVALMHLFENDDGRERWRDLNAETERE